MPTNIVSAIQEMVRSRRNVHDENPNVCASMISLDDFVHLIKIICNDNNYNNDNSDNSDNTNNSNNSNYKGKITTIVVVHT